MVGVLIAILIALLVKHNKQSEQTFILLKNPLKLENQRLTLLKQSQVWFIAFSYAMIYFSLEYFSENEGKHLLMSKGFSSTFASYMITLAWLGFAIGSPLFGYLSDRISRRKPLLIFSATITFLSLIGIIYLPLTKLGALITFFIYGLSIGSSSIGIAIMAEQFKFDNISTGIGIKNTVTIMFISIMAPVVSYLLTLTSNNTHYTLIDFQQVFLLIILFPLTALLFYTFKVRETYCRSTKEAIILSNKNASTSNSL